VYGADGDDPELPDDAHLHNGLGHATTNSSLYAQLGGADAGAGAGADQGLNLQQRHAQEAEAAMKASGDFVLP